MSRNVWSVSVLFIVFLLSGCSHYQTSGTVKPASIIQCMKTIKKIPGNQLEGWFIANASDDQEVNGVVWTEPNVANGKRSTVIFLDRPLNDSCISLLSSFLVMERERWGIYDSDSPGTDCRWWISTEPCMTLISSREKSLFQVILELQSRQVIKNCLAIGEMTKNIDE